MLLGSGPSGTCCDHVVLVMEQAPGVPVVIEEVTGWCFLLAAVTVTPVADHMMSSTVHAASLASLLAPHTGKHHVQVGNTYR